MIGEMLRGMEAWTRFCEVTEIDLEGVRVVRNL
jgi:hypothetical protein